VSPRAIEAHVQEVDGAARLRLGAELKVGQSGQDLAVHAAAVEYAHVCRRARGGLFLLLRQDGDGPGGSPRRGTRCARRGLYTDHAPPYCLTQKII
jgi:hypothetical protein